MRYREVRTVQGSKDAHIFWAVASYRLVPKNIHLGKRVAKSATDPTMTANLAREKKAAKKKEKPADADENRQMYTKRGGRIRQIAQGRSNESNVTYFHQKWPGENDAEARTGPAIKIKKQREKEPGELIRQLAYSLSYIIPRARTRLGYLGLGVSHNKKNNKRTSV